MSIANEDMDGPDGNPHAVNDYLNYSTNHSQALAIPYNVSTSSPVRCPTNISFTAIDPLQPSVLYKLVVDVYIAGALCLAGFFGNALSIAVLYRDREKHNTTNWLLQTLAFVDTTYLASCVFIQPIKTIHDMTDWVPSLKQVFPYIEPHIWGVASIAQTATVWMVLLVTADRYVAVCMPLHNQWRSLTRAKVAVAILLVVACLYNIPRFLEREYLFTTDCHGSTVVLTQRTDLRKNRNYFLIYKTICYFIFRAVGPLTTLILLNAQLIRALQVVRRRHKDMNKRAKHRENITAMLVVVVTVFVVCELPDLSLRIAFTVSEFGWVTLDVVGMRYANSISNTLLAVNSSCNFLIYCLVGKKFRRIFVQMAACNGGKYSDVRDVTETELITQTHAGGVSRRSPISGGVTTRGRSPVPILMDVMKDGCSPREQLQGKQVLDTGRTVTIGENV